MLHDPRTEDFQGPIVLPFGLPIYNNSTCWISLGNVIVELLGQAICRFIIVLYPFLRTRDLFVFNGGNGRAHGGERESWNKWKRMGQLRADGSQWSLIGLGEVCHEF